MGYVNLWETQFVSCSYSDKLLNKLVLLNSTAPNPVDIYEVKKSIYYAKKYHGIQKRLSGEPYYSHPLEVAYMLAEYTAEEEQKYFRTDLLVTAILHDTIEDTELTFEMIENVFGNLIAEQVMDLTRLKENGDKISSAKMLELLRLQKKNDLLLIKHLDRLHNMQTIEAKSAEKIKKIVNETFNSFIISAMHSEHKSLEKIMYQLCCKTLSIEMIPDEFSYITKDSSRLFYSKDTDTHQLVSQVFRNVTTQVRS